MARYLKLHRIALGLLSLFVLSTAQAQTEETVTTTVVTPRSIITPVPAPKEVIAIPEEGKVNCYKVEAGFYNNVWYPGHNVCQYKTSRVWVDSYWKCTAHKSDSGECTTWDWVAGHWVDAF